MMERTNDQRKSVEQEEKMEREREWRRNGTTGVGGWKRKGTRRDEVKGHEFEREVEDSEGGGDMNRINREDHERNYERMRRQGEECER